MSNVPRGLCDECLSRFQLAISVADGPLLSQHTSPFPARPASSSSFSKTCMVQVLYNLVCMEVGGRQLTSSSATEGTGSNNRHSHFHLPHLGKMHGSLHLHMPLPHFQLHSHSKKGGGHQIQQRDVPKGCVAVYVGQEGEEQQRFVVPVEYINHPLFKKLLKEAEEEYGFEQKGTITIPCHVSDFQRVHDVIDRDQHDSHAHGSCFH